MTIPTANEVEELAKLFDDICVKDDGCICPNDAYTCEDGCWARNAATMLRSLYAALVDAERIRLPRFATNLVEAEMRAICAERGGRAAYEAYGCESDERGMERYVREAIRALPLTGET